MVVIDNTVPAQHFNFGGDLHPTTSGPMVPSPCGFVRPLMTSMRPCETLQCGGTADRTGGV